MSERYATWIKIGGRIKKKRLKPLFKSIHKAGVSLDWGESPFEPNEVEELVRACRDDILHLCDDEARYGEFPELEATCRKLRLSYRRHTESICGHDASLIDWRPGMREPLWRRSSNEHTDETYVSASEVGATIMLLEREYVKQAIAKLKELCPDIPDLPLFEII